MFVCLLILLLLLLLFVDILLICLFVVDFLFVFCFGLVWFVVVIVVDLVNIFFNNRKYSKGTFCFAGNVAYSHASTYTAGHYTPLGVRV